MNDTRGSYDNCKGIARPGARYNKHQASFLEPSDILSTYYHHNASRTTKNSLQSIKTCTCIYPSVQQYYTKNGRFIQTGTRTHHINTQHQGKGDATEDIRAPTPQTPPYPGKRNREQYQKKDTSSCSVCNVFLCCMRHVRGGGECNFSGLVSSYIGTKRLETGWVSKRFKRSQIFHSEVKNTEAPPPSPAQTQHASRQGKKARERKGILIKTMTDEPLR